MEGRGPGRERPDDRVEGNHHFPAQDAAFELLAPSDAHSACPRKGEASYLDAGVTPHAVGGGTALCAEPSWAGPRSRLRSPTEEISMRLRTLDVIVIEAGPAGEVLADTLAKAGKSVVVIESGARWR